MSVADDCKAFNDRIARVSREVVEECVSDGAQASTRARPRMKVARRS